MRKTILITLLAFTLTTIVAYAESSGVDSKSEIFGISSEDVGGSSYLGVDTRDITTDRLGALKLKEERGVEVTMVDQDAPAGKAGLKEHDVILTVNGAEVESVEQLRRMIRETPPGRIVALGLSRDGQPMTIKVQLADRKTNNYAYGYSYGPKGKDFHFEMPPMPPMPPMPDVGDMDIPVSIVVVHSSARSGLMVENLTPQLGDFFGTKNGQGVLVRSVEKGSRADKAGFRAGDVIVKINGEAIHDSSDFSHALRSRKDNTANVGVIRDKKEVNITITLPERKQSEYRESLITPEMDAETGAEWSKFQSEMAELKPEMEEAVNRAMEQVGPEVERYEREMVRQNRDLQREMRDLHRSYRDRQREFEREFQNQSNDFF
ncbi:MAG TPA: PDZ domain-containing protein [Terriglobales bacterium]|nr:PDZ domain-containing protein [Terriglobales bacterium]